MDSLKKYHFKDEQGHPLENCQDYIDLLRREKLSEEALHEILSLPFCDAHLSKIISRNALAKIEGGRE